MISKPASLPAQPRPRTASWLDSPDAALDQKIWQYTSSSICLASRHTHIYTIGETPHPNLSYLISRSLESSRNAILDKLVSLSA